MTVGRTRTTAVVLSLLMGSVGALTLNGAAPASADPDVGTVKKQVDALYAQAEAASERYNAARIRLQESQVRLKALEGDVTSQQAKVDKMRDDVASLVVQQYQGNPLSAASQVVFSGNSRAFIDNLNAASSYSSRQGQVIDSYQVQLKQLTLRKAAAQDQVGALTKTREVLSTSKARIDEKAGAAKAELGKLQEKQRIAMLAGVKTGDLSTFAGKGAAAAAVRYALAQVGHPYVWGASGPGGFDCSGLVLAAWARSGVSLPHSSRAQMGSGRPVSESELQPGDLVFYYSPVHHVGMYIGNGMIVNAENPSVGVRVTSLHEMPYSGAVRPG